VNKAKAEIGSVKRREKMHTSLASRERDQNRGSCGCKLRGVISKRPLLPWGKRCINGEMGFQGGKK